MSRVIVLATTRRTPSWLEKAEAEYFRKTVLFRAETIPIRPQPSPEKEARAILSRVPSGGELILLEATGESQDSESFAKVLSGILDSGKTPVFAIGGPDGLPSQLRKSASRRMSLSPMTFAHAVARLMLAEQLFRADTLLRNHPYPR